MLATDAVGFGDVTEVSIGFSSGETKNFGSSYFTDLKKGKSTDIEMATLDRNSSKEPLEIRFSKKVSSQIPTNGVQVGSMILGQTLYDRRRQNYY